MLTASVTGSYSTFYNDQAQQTSDYLDGPGTIRNNTYSSKLSHQLTQGTLQQLRRQGDEDNRLLQNLNKLKHEVSHTGYASSHQLPQQSAEKQKKNLTRAEQKRNATEIQTAIHSLNTIVFDPTSHDANDRLELLQRYVVTKQRKREDDPTVPANMMPPMGNTTSRFTEPDQQIPTDSEMLDATTSGHPGSIHRLPIDNIDKLDSEEVMNILATERLSERKYIRQQRCAVDRQRKEEQTLRERDMATSSLTPITLSSGRESSLGNGVDGSNESSEDEESSKLFLTALSSTPQAPKKNTMGGSSLLSTPRHPSLTARSAASSSSSYLSSPQTARSPSPGVFGRQKPTRALTSIGSSSSSSSSSSPTASPNTLTSRSHYSSGLNSARYPTLPPVPEGKDRDGRSGFLPPLNTGNSSANNNRMGGWNPTSFSARSPQQTSRRSHSSMAMMPYTSREGGREKNHFTSYSQTTSPLSYNSTSMNSEWSQTQTPHYSHTSLDNYPNLTTPRLGAPMNTPYSPAEIMLQPLFQHTQQLNDAYTGPVTPLRFGIVSRAREEKLHFQTVRGRFTARREAEESERQKKQQKIIEEQRKEEIAAMNGRSPTRMRESSRAAYTKTHERKMMDSRMMVLLLASGRLAVLLDTISEDRARRYLHLVEMVKRKNIMIAMNSKALLMHKRNMLHSFITLSRFDISIEFLPFISLNMSFFFISPSIPSISLYISISSPPSLSASAAWVGLSECFVLVSVSSMALASDNSF